MHLSPKHATRLFSLTLVTLALGVVQAQAKTDFSGTWKVNTSKSDFGPMPAPDTMTQTITHAEPDLKAKVSTTGGPQGDMNYDVNYTTDGKECVNKVGEAEMKSTLKWDGDALMVETKGSFSGNEFTAKDKWSLSGDGKTMTVDRHVSSAMGDADMKLVFDKQ